MPIVVGGGANLDIKSRIAGRTVAATSNPGLGPEAKSLDFHIFD